jgi:hypothetical protein
MDTETWHVAITLADDGFDVTAKARFADCALDLVGLGVATIDLAEKSGRRAQALAALRSLESLAVALGQVAGVARPAPGGRA